MSAPALSVRGLGKRYSLGLTHAGSLNALASRWTRRLRGLPPADAPVDAAPGAEPSVRKGEFWALKDVSFEVQPGEVVGVIGRNGAGKSTLLKVLSRVTSPTTGEVRVRGRVGSLLEVGTGFHPELTGRENIYMNATLLGMSKREVRARLDEIVDFSGVERFLDTPVKRYSSGMKVRLGFAVAAHLEPEVLIVDEVLSVGDAEFQKKCLGKMKDVAGEGRTVLFVSHNAGAVRELTESALLFSRGSLVRAGATQDVLQSYFGGRRFADNRPACVRSAERSFPGLSGKLRMRRLAVASGRELMLGGDLHISVEVEAVSTAGRFLIGVSVYDDEDRVVGTAFSGEQSPPRPGAATVLGVSFPRLPLGPGLYHCAISVCDVASRAVVLHDSLSEVLHFDVVGVPQSVARWMPGWGRVRLQCEATVLRAEQVVCTDDLRFKGAVLGATAAGAAVKVRPGPRDTISNGA